MNTKIIGSLVALVLVVSGTTPVLAQTATITTPVTYGTTSSAVARVQRFLIDQKFLTATATGYYGALTAAAVERFQIAMGISPTYAKRVGPLTIAAINDVVAGKRSPLGASLPAVRTLQATDISSSSALLSGSILAPELAGSVTPSFWYGTTMAYGLTAQTVITDGIAAARVSGLSCGTTYHFKFTVENSTGASNGGDSAFTTLACGA